MHGPRGPRARSLAYNVYEVNSTARSYMCHRRRNQGGSGGWCPPKLLVYMYLFYAIMYSCPDTHGRSPPIESDLPTPLKLSRKFNTP